MGFPEAAIANYFATKKRIARGSDPGGGKSRVCKESELLCGTGSQHGVEEYAQQIARVLLGNHGGIDGMFQ